MEEKLRPFSPAVRAEILAAHNDVAKMAGQTVLMMWRNGRRIDSLQAAPASNHVERGADRVSPVGVLAEITGYSRSMMDLAHRFYRRFPEPAAAERIASMRMRKSNRPLTWGHIAQLMSAVDQDVLDGFVAQTIENDWDIATLKAHMELDKAAEKVEIDDSKGKPGRPPTIPATLEGALSRIISQTSVIAKYSQAVYCHDQHGILAMLSEMDEETVTRRAPAIGALLNQAIESIHATQDKLAELVAAAEKGQEVLQRVCGAKLDEDAMAEVSAILTEDTKGRRRSAGV